MKPGTIQYTRDVDFSDLCHLALLFQILSKFDIKASSMRLQM
jgi:hypothetical protein